MEKLNEIQHLEVLIDGQAAVLEMITQDKPIKEILEEIVLWVERQAQQTLLASILFLDKEGRHLLIGAAPSLPPAYNNAIHGIEIGNEVGSCGTAAFTKKQVIVEDIEHDKLWANYKDVALKSGLRACWSTPLLSKQGNVLGTFAIYYKETRKPTEEDMRIIRLVSRTTVIALENKMAKEAKLVSEQNFRLMTDSIPAIVWVAESTGKMQYINNRWGKYTGYTSEKIPENNNENIIHPEDFQTAINLLGECRKSHTEFEMYLRIRNAKGVYRWHLTLAVPFLNEEGEVVKWYGSSMDVHDQKILVEDLQKTNEHSAIMADELQKTVHVMDDERKLLRDLLMNAPAIICILRGPEHRFELINPHYQALFPGRELLGKKVIEALPEVEKQGFIDLLNDVYKTGKPFVGNSVLVNIEDEESSKSVYLDFLYHPLYKNGKIDGISVFAHDVSKLVDLEALLKSKMA